jgi:hypothetical protein
VLRPWLKVARPDDWTGTVARLGAGLVTLILLLAALLGALPRGWIQLAGGNQWLVRGILVLFVAWSMGWARAILYALLPRAPVLLGKRLTIPLRGERIAVPVARIAALHVERRVDPLQEVFVIEMGDGTEYDVCPVHWEGAQRLYRALDRRVR